MTSIFNVLDGNQACLAYSEAFFSCHSHPLIMIKTKDSVADKLSRDIVDWTLMNNFKK